MSKCKNCGANTDRNGDCNACGWASKDGETMQEENLYTLEQVWDAVWRVTEGLEITYDRHDLADAVCDKLDEGKK